MTHFSTLARALPDPESTEKMAQKLANFLPDSLIITLSGDLGAGKTTFVRAMLRALGITSAIKSPTFSLVESYCTAKGLPIHHFDLYRIQEESELAYLGFRDYFSEPAICCLEWPEHAGNALNTVDLQIILTMQEQGRFMHMQAKTVAGEKVLSRLAGVVCA